MDQHLDNSFPTPEEFLDGYDREIKNKVKFQDKYVRQTFLIDKQLLREMNSFLKKRPGFKTQFINFALRRCLHEMSPKQETSGPSDASLAPEPEQMKRDQVIALLDEYWNPKMVLTKNEIKRRLLDDLFSKTDIYKTSLEIKDGKFVSPRRKRRYYSKFDTARDCICDLIDFYNEEKMKRKKEQRRKEQLQKKQSNSLLEEDARLMDIGQNPGEER